MLGDVVSVNYKILNIISRELAGVKRESIRYGVKNTSRMSADLHVESNQEGKATFYNVKNTYKDLTHTSIAVNQFTR